jgi:hypothetical protein
MAAILRTRESSSIVEYPFRSGKGPHDIGTVDVFCRRERGFSSVFRRRRQQNKISAAAMRPAAAAAIAMPMMAPVERPFDEPTAGTDVADEVPFVGVEVTVAVEVKIGGRARVGGILMDEHAVRFEDRQQNDVALGELLPQYVHS